MATTGALAPEFTLTDLDGTGHRLSDALDQGPVLLVIWQAGCGTCKLAAPYLNRLRESYPDAGWTFWMVAQDAASAAGAFAGTFTLRPTVLVDGPEMTVSDAYDPDATPAFYLIESDGHIDAAFDGFDKEWLNEVSRRIAGHLGEPYAEIAPPDDGVARFRPG